MPDTPKTDAPERMTYDIVAIERSNRRWHGTDIRCVSVRWEPYKPDGARQMGTKGRWQEMQIKGDFPRWVNCDRPTNLNADTDDTANLLAAAEARMKAAEAEALEWRKVAMSATPGGSEYTSREITAQHIAGQKEALHKARCDVVLEKRAAETALAQARADIERLEAENFALAAFQCPHPVAGEHGHPLCQAVMDARADTIRASAPAGVMAEVERVRRMEEALRPFAEAAEHAEATMKYRKMSDEMSVGWGIKAKHAIAARAALAAMEERK